MVGVRNWVGKIVLRSPASFRSLRNIPILGDVIHGLSYGILSPDHKVWAQIEEGPARGIWLELNPRTGQEYLHGQIEHASQATLARKLRPGGVFYDLGANIGLFSLLAAQLVGTTGKVFSFEPDHEIAERLRRNVGQNNFANITVVEAGAWSSSGMKNFTPSDRASPDRGVGTFAPMDGSATGTPIRCFALDDFNRDGPPPDAIKCDVEGGEVEVLLGAIGLLRSHRPWILCEMHSKSNDRTSRELLSNLGYSFETVDNNHLLAVP
jgi:FkbM family methyltransferase